MGTAKAAHATLGFGILGGARARLAARDEKAMPPVGKRGAALFGVVGGALGAVGGSVFLLVGRALPPS